MSKPDWKDAPEWANWLAMDDDGDWFWYEKEPELGDYGTWVRMGGRALCAPRDKDWIDHKNTKEAKP